MRKSVGTVLALVVFVASLAGCARGGEPVLDRDPSDIVVELAESEGSDQIQQVDFSVRDGKITYAAIDYVKDGELWGISTSGEKALPAGDLEASAVVAAEDFPADEVYPAVDGIDCPWGSDPEFDVSIYVLYSGKTYSEVECGGFAVRQRIDGKELPDIRDRFSAEALDTMLAEAEQVSGGREFLSLSIEGHANDGSHYDYYYDSHSTGFIWGIRRFQLIQADGMRFLRFYGSDFVERRVDLTGISGEQLASAIQIGSELTGDELFSVQIYDDENGEPLLVLTADEAVPDAPFPGQVTVDLQGNAVLV